MKEQSANKLDKLFKEKLQHAEISPEDNYWPFIEQKINKPSFLKFGLRHINIYNLSIGLLLLLVSFLYLFKNQPKEDKLPITNPIEKTTSSSTQIETNKPNENIPASRLNSKQEVEIKTRAKTLSTIETVDSTSITTKPIENKEPAQAIILDSATTKPLEKKKKQKEIIYIIQQDTIVEKDTVKVRRLRKK